MSYILEIIPIILEIAQLVQQMQADGSFQSFSDAITAAEKEMQSPNGQALITKIESLFQKKA